MDIVKNIRDLNLNEDQQFFAEIIKDEFGCNTCIEEVVLPQSLEKLGGDCFYYCKNLKKVNIPKNVRVMGDNPFAGCPKLEITNESPNFILQDGVLYNREKTVIICYPIKKTAEEFSLPNGIRIVGKHIWKGRDAESDSLTQPLYMTP